MKNNNRLKIIAPIFLCLLLILTCQSASAAEKKAKERLAVFDLEAKHGIEKSLAEALSVNVRDQLHSYGEYTVMSQDDIRVVATREQILQAMGCADNMGACLNDISRALGTRYMVAGTIAKVGATYTVSLRMLDTKGEGAGVKNRVSESCKCNEDSLIFTVQNVAAKLMEKKANFEEEMQEEPRVPIFQEIKKAPEEIEQRLAEEKKKIEEAEEKRNAKINEERQKAEAEKQRIASEVEALKKEKEKSELLLQQNRPILLNGKSFVDPLTGMEFVFVQGGCFQMGCIGEEKNISLSTSTHFTKLPLWQYPLLGLAVVLPAGCAKTGPLVRTGECLDDELPIHEVCVDSFYIGKYEVTQGEFRTVVGSNPSAFQKGDTFPVENVSWNEAQNFIHLLNSSGVAKYRLPTEAEWEYSARSRGRADRFSGSTSIDAVAWYNNNSNNSTHLVGQKRANLLGIHDMSGNVSEWCEDWYKRGYYLESQRKNPSGAESGSYRVYRGGGWNSELIDVRTTYRRAYQPVIVLNSIGFRLVLPIHQEVK